ncbi:type II secretion system F family protein [Candidatus Woesearchaeota archaeon]|nr:type II secretion system F family protein [Candidatus Woesearchaeota archaeon]
MGFSSQLFEGIGKAFVFDRMRPKLKAYFAKAGIDAVPYSSIGILFWLSILPVAYIFIFKVWGIIIEKSQSLPVQFLMALLAWAIIHGAVIAAAVVLLYSFIDLRIFNRTKKMEAVLPDFLRLVSENLKGGMPFEKSLWSAIKPEFGVLSQEVRLAAKRVMTGTDVDEAITSFTKKYDSPMLKRSFDLIVEGMKGGGRVADVIDRVIDTIEQTKELKADMAATNLSYVIFVVVIVIIVAPGLFTLSFQFLTILQNIGSKLGESGGGGAASAMPISFGNVAIDPQKFKDFSKYAIMVIALFAGMIISIITKGSIKGGIRFIPFLFLGSQIVYAIGMSVGTSIFAGLTGFG